MALHITKGSGAPTSAPTQIGEHYVDTTNKVHYLSVGMSTIADWIQVSSGATAISFLNLTDTPSSYAGSANKQVYVNSNANGLDFRTPPSPGATAFTGLSDTPSSYVGQGGKRVQVNAAQTGLEFVPAGSASLPPGGTVGQSLTKVSSVDGDATWWDTIHLLPQTHAVYVDWNVGDDTLIPNRGEIQLPFKTIKAACDYVATFNPTTNNDYAIRVQPGVYTEQPIVMPNFTGIFGLDILKAKVRPAVDGSPLITLGAFCNVVNLNLEGLVNGVSSRILAAPCIYTPYAVAVTLVQLLISSCDTGIHIASGYGASTDIALITINSGELGNVNKCLKIGDAGPVNVSGTQIFGVGTQAVGTYAIEMNAGQLNLSGGKFSNFPVAIYLAGGQIVIQNVIFANAPTAIACSGDNLLIINSCEFASGTQTPSGILNAITLIDSSYLIMNGCTFLSYETAISLDDTSTAMISTSYFTTLDAVDGIAIKVYGSCFANIRSCTFFGSNVNNTTAIDVSDFAYCNLWSSMFFDYNIFIIADGMSQIQVYTCGFEDASAKPGVIGIITLENGYAFLYTSYFICDIGILGSEESLVYLYDMSLSGATLQFQQSGTCLFVTYESEFNEDDILVENWDYMLGSFHSTKAGDQGLFIIDKLKVGVPEVGSLSAYGQGNSFSRGMLVYEFDSVTDTFTDVTEIAKNPAGDFGIPNGEPDSAVYFGCTLVQGGVDPIRFTGVYLTQSITAVLGSGNIIAEYWDGTSWTRTIVMLTQAQEPYAVKRLDDILPGESLNIRFADNLPLKWQLSDPIEPPLNKEYYWFRVRVASNWADADWPYRIKVTVPASSITGSQTNFQTFLDLANISEAAFWTNVKVDGGDIRITDADGVSQLPMELVTFNQTAKTGNLYFTKPSFTNAAPDYYYIYYGNQAASTPPPISQYGAYQVWKDYVAVYHMSASGQNFADSTINQLTGGGVRETVTTGKFGFQGAGDNTNGSGIFLPSAVKLQDPGRALTYDVWFRCAATQTQIQSVIALPNTNTAKNDFFAISILNSGIMQYEFNATAYSSTINVVSGTVYQLATFTINTNTGAPTPNLLGFLNGVQRLANTQTIAIPATNLPIGIGNRGTGSSSWFNGPIDEVRIANISRSLSWHQTLYSNMNANGSWQTFSITENQATAPGSNPITVAPRWSQGKLWPSSAVINIDGYQEYFGKARQVRRTAPTLVDFNSGAGTDYAAAGSQLWLSQDFGITARYTFTPTGTKRITAMYRFGNDSDQSCPVRFRFKIVPRGAVAGDVLWKVIVASASATTVYYTTSAAAPVSVAQQESLSLITLAATQQNYEVEHQVQLEFPGRSGQISSQSQADVLWITVERLGDSSLDTYAANVDLVSLDIFTTAWRLGAHTTF